VLLQVLSGVALLLGYRAWRFRMRGSTSLWRPLLTKLVLVGLFALTSLLLPKLGLQGGVLAMFFPAHGYLDRPGGPEGAAGPLSAR